ncbi:C-GCAxxG-C-C family protein [Cloacibacillus sp. An23]|uniref:C-GCAxxG-C-C family protein n=1 Tax=Cloacibacillus sp. An23 TaxID=1965591 RepID=UPI000B36B9C3|nr:C-GCAxxG-C-C family protein [Cloacibacillus sp. An23]OUO93401.1 hypothetical protein B5F39_06750 [Cloacibacillus sp. An23]
MERTREYIPPDELMYGFDHGINCAMYVFGTLAPKLGFDTAQARRIAALIGGGMGRSATCGCVTGAYMALGYKFANDQLGDVERLNHAKSIRQEFNQRFIEKFGSLDCSDILNGLKNCDSNDLAEIQKRDLYRTTCTRAINFACTLTDELIQKYQ